MTVTFHGMAPNERIDGGAWQSLDATGSRLAVVRQFWKEQEEK